MQTTIPTRPTGEQVWQAVIKDKKFANDILKGSPQRKAFRPFAVGSIEALAEQLDNLVTVVEIIQAKAKFLQYCLENSFCNTYGVAVGMNPNICKREIEINLKLLESDVERAAVYLKKQVSVQEMLLVGSTIGVNSENIRKWRVNELTIGELLVTQPSVILHSIND
jgi:hypothetical protein